MSAPKITFTQVSKSYGLYRHMAGGVKNVLLHPASILKSVRNSRFEALRDISFDIFPGETFGIIGRNGAGKSTTLGLIAGVLKPSRGQVSVRGRVSPLLELGAGFHPELTGKENILLNGVLLGLTRSEVRQRMTAIIDFSELGDFIDQPIRIYSSGMLARLGFAVIANLNPDILLIDEVLAVGDQRFQKKCLDKIMEFKNDGVTIVFVSHSMDEILRICDRVAWIEDHTVRMLGAATEVAGAYTRSLTLS